MPSLSVCRAMDTGAAPRWLPPAWWLQEHQDEAACGEETLGVSALIKFNFLHCIMKREDRFAQCEQNELINQSGWKHWSNLVLIWSDWTEWCCMKSWQVRNVPRWRNELQGREAVCSERHRYKKYICLLLNNSTNDWWRLQILNILNNPFIIPRARGRFSTQFTESGK